MRFRNRYELRGLLCFWNVFLALFSTLAFLRMAPELRHVWYHSGFKATFCDLATYYEPPNLLWVYLFTLSKVLELGDTVFIILRKQPLYFVHWYHHITVMVYVWYSSVTWMAPGRWFISMNLGVHSLMYTYYAMKSMRVHVPRCISMTLTCTQISQMAVGLAVNILAYLVRLRGEKCEQSDESMYLCLAMYASYLVLFIHYFYRIYLSPTSSVSKGYTGLMSTRTPQRYTNDVTLDDTSDGLYTSNGYKKKTQ